MKTTQTTELKKIISRQGLVQDRLAKVANVDAALICKIASGERKPTKEQKDSIVWALNVLAAGTYTVENVFPPEPQTAKEPA